jgi:hypothetical protein
MWFGPANYAYLYQLAVGAIDSLLERFAAFARCPSK